LDSPFAKKIGFTSNKFDGYLWCEKNTIIISVIISHCQSKGNFRWGGVGGFYYIPLESQRGVFDRIGRENYIQLPKPGTNPRGAEITKEALSTLVRDKDAKSIAIPWKKTTIKFNPYKRWVDYWQED
jgi:hypothetical protein